MQVPGPRTKRVPVSATSEQLQVSSRVLWLVYGPTFELWIAKAQWHSGVSSVMHARNLNKSGLVAKYINFHTTQRYFSPVGISFWSAFLPLPPVYYCCFSSSLLLQLLFLGRSFYTCLSDFIFSFTAYIFSVGCT